MIRILIADDHGVMRKGLRLQLEQHEGLEVVGEASDGRDAVRLAEQLRPDLVIMDIILTGWKPRHRSSSITRASG